MSFKAIEFFSGIGAFAQAALSNQVDVIAAFDQSQFANQAYEKNYGLKPNSRNLDSIPLRLIPQADLWWLSPPCTPYSRRGRQRDVEDARAKSFLHLIECLKVLTPDVVLIENVDAFLNSKMHHILAEAFLQSGYQTSTLRLNPQMFGIPMQRPRIFLVATLFPHKLAMPEPRAALTINQICLNALESHFNLELDPVTAAKYGPVLNVVDSRDLDDAETALICFTSGYYQCRKASGSLLRLPTGVLRYFSPTEILALLGFDGYVLPDHFSLPICYRLLGNSVDVRAIDFLLGSLIRQQK